MILNKVVSKQIAEEILKGQVQLGGEDRIVTMYFLMYEFYESTALLAPQETIGFLIFI